MIRPVEILFAASAALVFSACSNEEHAGGVTDIGNSLAGVVVRDDGSPVARARVVAYYDSWNETSARDSVETVSDYSGRFRLEGIRDTAVVLFASEKSDCGFAVPLDTIKDTIRVGSAKRLTGRVAKATSGRMRIVGSKLFAELDAKGNFAFDSLPPGKISLAYIEPAGAPLSRFNFRTVDSRDSIALPDLENSKDSSWLQLSDDVYYSDTGYGGIVADAPVTPFVAISLSSALKENLYGFTFPVKFTSANLDFGKFSDPAHFDVRDANGKPLSFKADYWFPASSTGVLWIRLDTLPAGTDTLTLYLTAQTVPSVSDSVFRESDKNAAALLMNGDEKIKDAVDSNAQNGVIGAGVQLYKGQYVDLDSLDPCAGDFTLSIWVWWYGTNGNHQILFSERSSWTDTTSRFQWHYDNINSVFAAYNNYNLLSRFDSATVDTVKWEYLTLVFKSGKLSMYVNARNETPSPVSFWPTELTQAVPFRVGGDEIANEVWNGVLDEVRVDLTARSDEWIRASYETQKAAAN